MFLIFQTAYLKYVVIFSILCKTLLINIMLIDWLAGLVQFGRK